MQTLPSRLSVLRKATTLFLAFSFVLGVFPLGTQAASETITAEDASGWVSRPVSIDLEIGGAGDDSLELNLLVPNGTLSFGTTTGISFTGPNSGVSIKMSGTRSALNAALDTLTYVRGSTGTVTLEAWLGVGGGDFAYNEETKHVYQVVVASSTWAQAKTLAENSNFQGIPGYLATITTLQEHNFILARISEDGWIGGNDIAVEGEWRWQTGPEAGTQFWQGTASSTGGAAVGGMFTNWASNEPNNNTGGNPNGEDCAEVRFTAGNGGRWNDLPCDTERARYVVEYGTPGNLPVVVATSSQIVITAVPNDVLALEKIQEYADTNGGSSAPTVADYEDAGIEGVTADNLSEVNAKIADMDPSELSDDTAIQNAVTPIIAYHIIVTYGNSGGATTAPTVQNYLDAGFTGITEENLEEVNQALAGGSSVDPEALQALVDRMNEPQRSSRGSSVQSRVAALERMGNQDRANELKSEYTHVFGGDTIASLMARVAELQAQLAAIQGPTVRDLKLGIEGADVRALQEFLVAAGHAIPAGATGYFGTQTQAALAAYQAANNISPAVGYFGVKTRAQIASAGKGWW